MKVWLIFFTFLIDAAMASDLCTGVSASCSSEDIQTIGDMALCFVNIFGISVVLIFLPGLYSQTGFTIFGDGAESAGIYGADLFHFSSENLDQPN